MLDLVDKHLLNELQKGIPLQTNPFANIARQLEISEQEVVDRVQRLKSEGYWTRFGPMFNIERFGGQFVLCAMQVPEEMFNFVNEVVNGFAEVAHNYKRVHRLNMWFVLAVENPSEINKVCLSIEIKTGLKVYQMPKKKEYYVNLFFDVFQDGYDDEL